MAPIMSSVRKLFIYLISLFDENEMKIILFYYLSISIKHNSYEQSIYTKNMNSNQISSYLNNIQQIFLKIDKAIINQLLNQESNHVHKTNTASVFTSIECSQKTTSTKATSKFHVLKFQQTENPQKNNIEDNNNQYDDMSSGQIQKLKKMGVDVKAKTKKIVKEKDDKTEWRHDKYLKNETKQKPTKKHFIRSKEYWNIDFIQPQDYTKVYNIVKGQKAFIESIDENHIKFTNESAYTSCLNLLAKANIPIKDDKNLAQSEPDLIHNDKGSIFDRLK